MSEYTVKLSGREEITLSLKVNEKNEVLDSSFRAVGGLRLLKLIEQWRDKMNGNLSKIPLPEGKTTEAIILREVLLKAKGEWNCPFNEDELCHCRAIPTKTVDEAIVTGAHSAEEVSRLTSASTACGTCRPDVEAMIKYRLNH